MGVITNRSVSVQDLCVENIENAVGNFKERLCLVSKCVLHVAMSDMFFWNIYYFH